MKINLSAYTLPDFKKPSREDCGRIADQFDIPDKDKFEKDMFWVANAYLANVLGYGDMPKPTEVRRRATSINKLGKI